MSSTTHAPKGLEGIDRRGEAVPLADRVTRGSEGRVNYAAEFAAGPFTVFGLLASIGGLAVIIVYVVLCLGGAVWFRRVKTKYNVFTHGVIPIAGR